MLNSIVKPLLDNLSSGIMIVENNTIAYVNCRMSDLLNANAADLLGNDIAIHIVAASAASRYNAVHSDLSKLDLIYLTSLQEHSFPCSIKPLNQSSPDDNFIYLIEEIPASKLPLLNFPYISSIINNSLQSIIICDLDGNIIGWNSGATSIYGYSTIEVIGRNLSVIIPPDLRFSLTNKIISGETVEKIRTYAWTKQGILVNVEMNISPVRDRNMHIKGVCIFSRDITLDKMAEKQIVYQSRLLEAVYDSIVVADTDGKISYWNTGAVKLFGWREDEVIGKKYTVLFASEDFNNLFNNLHEMEHGQWEGVQQVNTASGKTKYARISISTLFDEMQQPDLIVIVLSDISEIVESRLNAEEAVRSKNEFMANISHEIRTPMSGIMGYAELLVDRITDPEYKKYLKVIKQNAGQVIDLLNDFLDLSKIEANSMILDEVVFDLYELIYSCTGVFEPIIKDKKMQFVINIDKNVPQKIKGDSKRIRQVLNNLISNAVKFTSSGYINIQVTPDDKKHYNHTDIAVRIVIKDTGSGIPSDKLNEIFAPFTQLDSSTPRKYGGTGLGLAISKRLVELMGGSIKVNSEIGRGSVFEFIVPLKKADAFAFYDITDDLDAYKKDKILLFSGENTIISDIGDSIVKADFIPVLIHNSEKIASLITFHQPRAIIIDLIHPVLDINNLLKFTRTLNIPAILYNDNNDSSHPAMAYTHNIITPSDNSKKLEKILQNLTGYTDNITTISDMDILIIDRNEINLRLLSEILKNAGYHTFIAANIEEAVNILHSASIAMILVDFELFDTEVSSIYDMLKQRGINIILIGLRSYDTQFDERFYTYITKPYNTQTVLSAVKNSFITGGI